MKKSQGIFRSGTSGLVLPEPNKKHYPENFQGKSRLHYYASKFNSIEVNSSFYKIPRGQTFNKWSLEVPDNFQFSVKLWKGITHNKPFDFQSRDIDIFFSALNGLGRKKGCLLIQFPATTLMDPDGFRKLLEQIRKTDPEGQWRLAIEFRHDRWYTKRVFDTIGEYGASLVLHDMPRSLVNTIEGQPPFVYLRFHGEKGDYRGTYDTNFLQSKAKEIKEWLSQGLDVYAYFNNTIGGAAGNLKTLNEMVETCPDLIKNPQVTPGTRSDTFTINLIMV